MAQVLARFQYHRGLYARSGHKEDAVPHALLTRRIRQPFANNPWHRVMRSHQHFLYPYT